MIVIKRSHIFVPTDTIMKITHYLSLSVLISFAVSCAPQVGGDGYDVANPYSAPDYVDETGTPILPSDVNDAYDAPTAYEDVAVAPNRPTVTAPKVHTVGRGDTLWGLSKQYGVSVTSIKTANGLTRDTIVLGAKLKIPAK
jgi:nucleoid-associated protein YgaU